MVSNIRWIEISVRKHICCKEYCSNYHTIDDGWRKIRDWMSSVEANSDKDNLEMDGNNWFRFIEPAGTKLPDTSPPKKSFEGEQICDTYAVAWMEGSHPNTTSEIVQRNVCFSWFRKKCMGGPLSIHVGKCNGNDGNDFYIYQLKQPSSKSGISAYCAL